MPEFSHPDWLWWLLVIPFIVWLRLRAPIAESVVKRNTGTLLRSLACGALILALAGPLQDNDSPGTDVMFVLDISDSIDQRDVTDALSLINETTKSKDPHTRVGLMVFGEDSGLERSLADSDAPFTDVSVEVVRSASNLAQAIELAIGRFDSERQRRIVLLSDGRENLGDARAAALVARSVGVELHTVALGTSPSGSEVFIRGLRAPGWVREHEPFDVDMTIVSQGVARAHLIITRNGSPIDERRVTLQPGENSFSFIDQAEEPGLYEYEVIVNSERDNVQENNRYQTFVQIRGAAKILHAFDDPLWGRPVTEALRAQGLLVDERPGTAMPASMRDLSEYDLVILNNISGLDMSLSKMELLEHYVRDAGGGLINLGGDHSYGAGGYQSTPVERLLPVAMEVKSKAEIPSLAVTIIIDKSGSMGSQDKLAIAKDAAFAAIEILKPIDTVGVLVFSNEPEWSVRPRPVGDRREIVERLKTITSGGGTALYPALNEAYRVMLDEPARVKHMILLSDGLSDSDEDFATLVAHMREDAMTVSSVAFGADADQSLMESIAAWGQGRYYFTKDPNNIPRIFTSETLVIARNLFVEGGFLPELGYPGEMLSGFESGFPPLGGYQRVFPKPAAQILLNARDNDPLLVSWRYGLGKSVAFASDLSTRWGADFVIWPQFGQFISQMARWTMRRRGTERLLATFSWSGNKAEVVVDALDRDDRYINGLLLEGSVTGPRQSSARFALEQIAPGRYLGRFPVPNTGRYYVNLNGSADGLQVGPTTFGFAIPYSAEYLELGADEVLLRDIAETAGGSLHPFSVPELVILTNTPTRTPAERVRVWWPALLFALVAMVAEIAVRKVVLPISWQQRWKALRSEKDPPEESQESYEELVGEIERAREIHLQSLRSGIRYQPDNPAERARLYVSQARRGTK